MEYPVSSAAEGLMAAKAGIRPIVINTQSGPTPTCLVGFYKLADTPINFPPICLSGHYQFNAADANDVLTVKATFKSNGSPIAAAEFTTSTSSFTFQNFCAMVNYTSAGTPTTFEILATMNELRPANATASYFILDDLRFSSLNVIEETSPTSHILVGPNPAHSSTRVSFVGLELGFEKLIITNAVGQVVKLLSISGSMIELQLEELPPGMYFLQVLKNDKVLAIEKLMKL
jgi:hypothetical protein